MGNPEIDRIRADMARCKQRIAEIEAGTRGVRTGQWATTRHGDPGAAVAHGNQLLGQVTALQRFQAEYVNTMIPVWSPARIIEKMEAPTPAPQVIQRPASDADVLAKLSEVLSHIPDTTPIGDVKRSLLQ